MSDLVAELTAFMVRYERANNTHDIARVAPMIDADATRIGATYEPTVIGTMH